MDSDKELALLLATMNKYSLSVAQTIDLIKKDQEKKVVKTISMSPLKIKLVVDYSKTLSEALAAGKYDEISHYINADSFPPPPNMSGKVQVYAKLFCSDSFISIEEMEAVINKEGFRSANFMELLTLGANYPNLYKKNPIVALQSKWRHPNSLVLAMFLRFDEGTRGVVLTGVPGVWGPGFRFLAIPL